MNVGWQQPLGSPPEVNHSLCGESPVLACLYSFYSLVVESLLTIRSHCRLLGLLQQFGDECCRAGRNHWVLAGVNHSLCGESPVLFARKWSDRQQAHSSLTQTIGEVTYTIM